MKHPLWVHLAIPIQATKENVWKALTEPQLTQEYMYNCQLRCTWEIGSEVKWVEPCIKEPHKTHVRGTLLEYNPLSCLRIAIQHDRIGSSYQSELQYSIVSVMNKVWLVIKQGDFSNFPNADETYRECLNGWKAIEQNLIATCVKVNEYK